MSSNREFWYELCLISGKCYAKEFAIKLKDLCFEKDIDLNDCNLKDILRQFSQQFAQYLAQELKIINNCDNNINSNDISEELSFNNIHINSSYDKNIDILGLNPNQTAINSNDSNEDNNEVITDVNQDLVPLTQTISEDNNNSNNINTNSSESRVRTTSRTGLATNGANCQTLRTASHDDYSDLSDNETETESPKTHYRKFFRRLSFKGLRKGLHHFYIEFFIIQNIISF
jgi:hypothetical protein